MITPIYTRIAGEIVAKLENAFKNTSQMLITVEVFFYPKVINKSV